MFNKFFLLRLLYSIAFAIAAALISKFTNLKFIVFSTLFFMFFSWIWQWYVLDYVFRGSGRQAAERFVRVALIVSGVFVLVGAYQLWHFNWLQDESTLIEDFVHRVALYQAAVMAFIGTDCYRRA